MKNASTDRQRRERLVHRTLAIMVPAGFVAALTNYLEAQPEVANTFLLTSALGALLWLFIRRSQRPRGISRSDDLGGLRR